MARNNELNYWSFLDKSTPMTNTTQKLQKPHHTIPPFRDKRKRPIEESDVWNVDSNSHSLLLSPTPNPPPVLRSLIHICCSVFCRPRSCQYPPSSQPLNTHPSDCYNDSSSQYY